ncbi:MAG UNVERIFIED_CONTAM: hypothetical protein LVR18_31900 [Planctomycetaceae bacterium]|jgi:hypothetical protein
MFGQKTQPTWFFRSSGHVEAVSRLMYLVESREPVGVITGPDGSGRSRVLERTALELQRTGESVVLMNLGGMEDDGACGSSPDSSAAMFAVHFNDTNCSPRSAMNLQVAGSAANTPLSCSMICIARNLITVCSCGS